MRESLVLRLSFLYLCIVFEMKAWEADKNSGVLRKNIGNYCCPLKTRIADGVEGFYFSALYCLGDMPFRREKNLLNEGVSAKLRRSAIWVMLSEVVRSR